MDSDEHRLIYDTLMGHTCKELRALARRHGISLGYEASNKRNMATRIKGQLQYEHGDFDVIMAIVDTPSSYAGVDDADS